MRGESEGGGEVMGEGAGEREEAATVVRENRRKGEGGGEGRVEGGGWRGKQDGAVYVNITRCHGGQSNHWYVHELSNSANCAYHFIPFYLHNTLCGVL